MISSFFLSFFRFVQISQIIIYLPLVSKEREGEYKIINSLTTFRENLKKTLQTIKLRKERVSQTFILSAIGFRCKLR